MNQERSPEPTDEPAPSNVVEFPLGEYMRARQRHPAGRLGKEPVQRLLEKLEQDDDPDDPERT